MKKCFTLVEVLVSIALLALLIGLLAPQLAAIRLKGNEVVSLSRLQNHLVTFSAYLADQRDTYPLFADPRATRSYVYFQDQAVEIRYFEQHATWHLGMGSGYVDDPSSAVFVAGGQPRGLITDFCYSCSFVAAPEFWNASSRTGPRQWGITRADQVVFPSVKGLLFCIHPYTDPDTVDANGWSPGGPRGVAPTGCCDGSAKALQPASFLRGYRTGEGGDAGSPRWPGTVHLGELAPTLHTIDGVRGRDINH